MWVIDIQDCLDKLFSSDVVPRLKVRLRKLAEIITYATANIAGISVDVQPMCWRRSKGKACKCKLDINLDSDTDQIHWRCPACGNRGAVTGWHGEFWDMTSTQLDACIILQ